METQETPTVHHLWHRSFWLLAAANLFLTISVYMLIPSFSEWLLWHFTPAHVGLIMGSYGIGLFLLGPYCSFLVQRYRRNRVCMVAIFIMALLTLLMYLCKEHEAEWNAGVWAFVLIRFMYGAAFGIAQMVLCSTLVIDTCESFQRTQANYVMSWYGRFGVAIGSLSALMLVQSVSIDLFLLVVVITCMSLLMIMLVKFPFRAPEDTQCRASLDRFFLPEGWPLFLNMVLIMAFVGIVLTVVRSPMFYAMMMCGFLFAILSEQLLFLKFSMRGKVFIGLFLVSLALMLTGSPYMVSNTYVSPACMGFGVGIIGSSFLLSLIKLSHHCQRGTSQSTFFLSWELGISVGLFLGYAFLRPYADSRTGALFLGLSFLLVAASFYYLLTYPWYLRHKNRE